MNKKILRFTCTALLCLCSCSGFLDNKPKASLSEPVLATRQGAEALLIGAYAMLDGTSNQTGFPSAASNWIYGSIAGGDAHKGSFVSDLEEITAIELYNALNTNSFFDVKWRAVYEGVTRANTVLKIINDVDDALPGELERMRAEALALRGIFHFEAKKIWNNVPFIDEQVDPNGVKNDKDIWPQIETDLKFAYDHLPETMDAVGRVNKWAAGAFYAKVLMFEGKYAEAKPVLEALFTKGKNPLGTAYALNPKYGENFNVEKENSGESVFAFQYSVHDGSDGTNGGLGEIYNYPMGGPGQCCGFFHPSSELVNSFRTDAEGLPFLDGAYNTNTLAVKDDEAYASADPFTEDAGTLDPRIDWTVGRRGIPYLDWGDHPGKDWWMRPEGGNGGPYTIKKNVFRKDQEGVFTESWSVFNATNYTVIRFADIILWLAECEVEIGSLNTARDYVNLIRARAARPEGFVTEADGTTPAAHYDVATYALTGYPFDTKDNARKAVHFEHKLEFGMEGHRFFDLVRWHEAATTLQAYVLYEKTKRQHMTGANFDAGVDEYFAIPQHQIDLIGKSILAQNPGHE